MRNLEWAPFGGVLREGSEVVQAKQHLERAGDTLHQTEFKNWDLSLFLSRIEETCPKTVSILDVGCAGNPILYNLARRGYRRLWGIDFNLVELQGLSHPTIQYMRGNLLKVPLPDASVDCITSISVIEHGVQPEAYLSEMARLLKPGGRLLTSTDYWRWPVTTFGFPASRRFGLPWKCFTPRSLRRLLSQAVGHGFEPVPHMGLDVKDKVVRWHNKRYTFVAFELVRAQSP